MRRSTVVEILFCVLLLVVGCEEPFTPKAEFRDQNVLQCFVEGIDNKSPTTQTALLARVYDVTGFDPAVNTNDPAVAGAEVTILVNGKPTFFQEGFRASTDTTRYGPRQRYYFKLMVAPGPEDAVSIIAKLPGGQILSAQTTVPRMRAIASSIEFPKGVTTRMNFPPGTRNWTILWEDYEETWGHLFFPRMMIDYKKSEGGIEQGGTLLVPSSYVSGPNGRVPAYYSYLTQKFCTFDFAALDSAMAQISAGDPVKSRYSVHRLRCEVIEYDTPLSKYYSSINGSLDQFSIRVDQPVFSNVGGGIGILGSYYRNWVYFDLDISYVKLFGYQYR